MIWQRTRFFAWQRNYTLVFLPSGEKPGFGSRVAAYPRTLGHEVGEGGRELFVAGFAPFGGVHEHGRAAGAGVELPYKRLLRSSEYSLASL